MPVSSLLEILEVSENQAAKATAANTSIQMLEKALAEILEVVTTSATSPGTDLTLPYAAGDLGNKDSLRCIAIRLNAGATEVFNVIHPTNKHLFVLINSTSQVATIKCSGQSGVPVGSGDTSLLYCNGTDVIGLNLVATGGGGALTHPRELSFSYYGSPPASTEIGKIVVANNITFPADFAGSVGFVETNPGSAYAIDVQDDGVSIGTISISAAGAFTFTTTGNAQQIVVSGSVLTLISSATPDGALTEIHVALEGTV